MTSWAARRFLRIAAPAALAALCASAPAAWAKPRNLDPIDLTAVFLSPALSTWMIGPVGRMASDEEIAEYVALTSDEEAESFVEEFWRRRDPDPETPANPVLEEFEKRAEEADKLYREAGQPGRRTDRGTVFVLYGAPEETEFRIVPRGPFEETVEEWRYPKDAPAGLDGERPERVYRFAKEGDLTVLYRKPIPRSVLRPR